MDNYRDDIKLLINKLPEERQSFFSLLCCERLFDNYNIFSLKYRWGDPTVLIKGIDCILNYIKNNSIDSNELRYIIGKIDEITPNTEDYDTILVSFALDACNSVNESLNFLLSHNIEKIVDVATFARDTVDMYIQIKEGISYNDPKFEKKIANDYFMLQEKTRQKEHLRILESLELNNATIDRLRIENKKDKIIDISLLPQDIL